jgi:hypothetical protein
MTKLRGTMGGDSVRTFSCQILRIRPRLELKSKESSIGIKQDYGFKILLRPFQIDMNGCFFRNYNRSNLHISIESSAKLRGEKRNGSAFLPFWCFVCDMWRVSREVCYKKIL